MSDGQVTVDGLPLVYNDGIVKRTVADIVGWYDSPALRTAFTARPFAPGSYYTPAFQDDRKVTITGRVLATDTVSFIKAKRQLAAVASDPYALSELRVDDDAGSLATLAQRDSQVLFKPVGPYAADYSLSLTAPDPRLLGPTRAVSTPMAQPGGIGGIQWNGAGATSGSNLLVNPDFESGVTSWSSVNLSDTLASSVVRSHSGSASALLTPGPSGEPNPTIVSGSVSVTGGQAYRVSGWIYLGESQEAFPGIYFYDSTGALLAVAGVNRFPAPSGWSQVSGIVMAPAAAFTAKAFFGLVTSRGALVSPFYIDDTSLFAVSSGIGTAWNGPAGTTGLEYGAGGASGVVTVDNTDGTAPADLILTITGPALNPSISTATRWVTYNGVLGANDVLVIDTGSGSVLLNGVNRRPYLTRAQFFQVPAASSLDIRFTAEIQNSVAQLTASMRVSYS